MLGVPRTRKGFNRHKPQKGTRPETGLVPLDAYRWITTREFSTRPGHPAASPLRAESSTPPASGRTDPAWQAATRQCASRRKGLWVTGGLGTTTTSRSEAGLMAYIEDLPSADSTSLLKIRSICYSVLCRPPSAHDRGAQARSRTSPGKCSALQGFGDSCI